MNNLSGLKVIPVGCDLDLTMQENEALKLQNKKLINTMFSIIVVSIGIIAGMIAWSNNDLESKKKSNLPTGWQKED